MAVDVTKEPRQQDTAVSNIQSSQILQLSQDCTAQGVLHALEEGALSLECLKEFPPKKLKKFLPTLSDSAILHISEIICRLGNVEYAVLMCTDVFLTKLNDSAKSCSRSIVEAMKQVTSAYPAEASMHLLGPLIVGAVDNQQTLLPIIAALAPQHKLIVTRAVVESITVQLSEWQAALLQVVIVPSTDDILNEKIIMLLLKSGQGLSSSAKFGQLLITVIQKIGPVLPVNKREYLAAVLAEHNTVARKIGEKALKALT